MVICPFQGIGPFNLNIQIYVCWVVHSISLLPSHVSEMSIVMFHVTFLILETCVLSLSNLSILLDIYLSISSVFPKYFVSLFSPLICCFQFHWFLLLSLLLPETCFGFILLFSFQALQGARELRWLSVFSSLVYASRAVFPLRIAFSCAAQPGMLCARFHLVQDSFGLHWDALFDSHEYLEVCCWASECLEIFLGTFCRWFLVWFYCNQRIRSLWF